MIKQFIVASIDMSIDHLIAWINFNSPTNPISYPMKSLFPILPGINVSTSSWLWLRLVIMR